MLDKEGRAAKEAAAQLIKLQKAQQAKVLARIKQGETVNTVSTCSYTIINCISVLLVTVASTK
jgi:hypothetical protein